MAIMKCKMCGGDLNLTDGKTVAECEYCGTLQTVPIADDEKKLTLFARANRLRAACEFDKAAGIYESIVADFPEEAEAYWGLVLCKFGIEYVDDPATAKKIPTCHRSSFESIMDDSDFDQTLENADSVARKVYREEAKVIEEIRKGIIAVSNNEEPYDIFICYKETAEDGERTLDSVLAQDLYDTLTDKGYRVFFARITLEDKLGQEYEPYIFAALNSAKIMLAIGTDYEYFNAVWVKNEWSRFLKLMAKDKEKHLIPCYKGIDAYDMPKEFNKLQAQDLGKVGATQDLLRGISKIMPKQSAAESVKVEVQQASQNSTVQPHLERAFLFLEDGNWESANEYCEKVLDVDPKNASAYLGKLMVDLHVKKQDDLKNCPMPFSRNQNYLKVLRFGDDNMQSVVNGYIEHIRSRNAEDTYQKAMAMYQKAQSAKDYEKAGDLFGKLGDYKDAKQHFEKCQEEGTVGLTYAAAVKQMDTAVLTGQLISAAEKFEYLGNYLDSAERAVQCRKKIAEMTTRAEYAAAKQEMLSDKIPQLQQAYARLKKIPDYEDSRELLKQCREKMIELQEKEKRRAALVKKQNELISQKLQAANTLFAGKRVAALQAEIDEITKQLKQL